MNIKEFERYLKVNCKSKTTIKTYLEQINPFLKYCDNKISQEKIDDYMINRKKNVSTATCNLFINALKKYCYFANFYYKIPEQKAIKRKVKPYWTIEELEKEILPYLPIIFRNYDECDLIIRMMFFVGVRPEELCNFKITDIDFSKEFFIVRNGKGDKDRIIPFLDNKIPKELKTHSENTGGTTLFNINYPQLRYIFTTLKEKLNIEYEVTPKITRKSFAKYCVRLGLDSLYIKQLLGHEDIKTTEIYAEPDEKMLIEACEKIKRK